MPDRIPIRAAKLFAKELGLRQVIIAAWDGELTHVVTYGVTAEDCDQAAMGGERMKAAMGWPETANALPSRVKQLKARAESAEKERGEAREALRRIVPQACQEGERVMGYMRYRIRRMGQCSPEARERRERRGMAHRRKFIVGYRDDRLEAARQRFIGKAKSEGE